MIYTVTLNPAIDYVIEVPDFKEGQLNKTNKELSFPGGKGINVSRVLHELGVSSKNLGFIGGFTGQFIASELEHLGLCQDFITVDGDTRINIKLKSEAETEINGLGPVITKEDTLALIQKIEELTQSDWLVLSGSLPTGIDKDIYTKLAQIADDKHIPFVVDISDKSLFDILKYQPMLVKPNEHELAELFDTTFTSFDDLVVHGKKLLAMGAKNVLITMGKDGAILINEVGTYQVDGLKGTLINSVGSGDSVVAGFISQLSQGKNTLLALRYGIASGSATAFNQDLATLVDIERLLDQVVIKVIEEN